MKSPAEIVAIMMEKDVFSKWLSISVLQITKGNCELQLEINDNMLNGFEIAHGGISYSLADSALAFAANSYGQKCISIETSISHTKPSKLGDSLIASATELNRGKSLGVYQVIVKNQENKTVALLKGTVHISEEIW